MTLKELKENIAASPHKEWWQNYSLNINYPHIGYKTTLNGVVNIYEFISHQAEGFTKLGQIPDELNKLKVRFINAKGNILKLISQGNISKSTWDQNLVSISSNYNNQPNFLFESSEIDFLLKTYKERPVFFPGAYEYLSGSITKITQKNFLAGYLLAYEFSSKDFSTIAERKEAEKKSIQTTRANFQEKLGEAEKEVVEYLTKTNQKFDEYAKQIEIIKTEKNKTFDEWFSKTSGGFTQFNIDSQKAIKDLENLYQEKLKLEAPAKYWSDRAKKLRTEGYWWLGGFVVCIGVAVAVLIWVLSRISDGTFDKIFRDTGTAIKWSVALITLISFLAFLIRTFSKLTFSSFHLVRDAEEREQLTYVYLALQKEKGIDQTERHLIMQSLFSRADSGLLKDDASPTMPGNIADPLLKRQ